jgi:hypothetical protein
MGANDRPANLRRDTHSGTCDRAMVFVPIIRPDATADAVHAAIKAAGLKAWPDLFQALRRSCETDLAMHFPQHAVSAWLGHGINVSAKHNLQVPAELYERAAAGKTNSALQNALQHGAARGGTERQIA